MSQRRPDGALEQEVLLQLWNLGRPATPGEVLDEMNEDLAYTTVMTILSRLWQKRLVVRKRRGRAFEYSPVVSEAELTARRMHESLSAATDPKAALVTFAGSLSSAQARALRSLLSDARSRRKG